MIHSLTAGTDTVEVLITCGQARGVSPGRYHSVPALITCETRFQRRVATKPRTVSSPPSSVTSPTMEAMDVRRDLRAT